MEKACLETRPPEYIYNYFKATIKIFSLKTIYLNPGYLLNIL